MPTYRVISEPYRAAEKRFTPSHRRLRGDESIERVATTVEAPDVMAALSFTIKAGDHRKRSITSIEELVPVEALYFTDAQITDALALSAEPGGPIHDTDMLCVEDYPNDEVLSETDSFSDTVEAVAALLSRSLVPGLRLTVVREQDLDDYAIIEIRDAATRTYLSATEDVADLIQDRDARGWDGVLSTAKAIIYSVNELV